jgi:hypothetical protein
MLLGARPLHAHRFADCARKQRCVAGGILVPIAAVTAWAFHVNPADVRLGNRKHRGELLAQIMCRLRYGPAGELPSCKVATAQEGPIEP